MNDPVAAEPAGGGGNAWASDPRTLLLVGSVVFALLGLLALASAIDLPTRQDSASQREDIGDQGSQRVPGRVELGPGGEVDIRPLPDCPGGFSIGENIYVVPDPEACGFVPLAPGEQARRQDDLIILSPGTGGDGEFGRIRINPDGTVELLPPGEFGPNDFSLGWSGDGVFGLIRPDGSRVEIVPGDDGLSLRDPSRGGSSFVPRAPSFDSSEQELGGQEFGGSEDESLDAPPTLAQPDASEPLDQNDDSPRDWSSLGPLLLVLAGLCFLGFLVFAVRRNHAASNDDEDDGADPVPEVRNDYAAEINALDRLLWEIDQEPDPRLAIQRVYAALETGLDNPQMARKLSETPGIYLGRILGHFAVLAYPLQDLTYLFEQARFSEHEITPDMRERAVGALVAVRGHYAHAAQVTAEESTLTAL